MLEYFLYAAFALAAIVVVFLIVVAMQPTDFRITRSAVISAPLAEVFGQVNNFQRWEAWSPWAKLDPDMKLTIAGPPAGTGATYHWVGNSKAGEGRMTLLESRPNELIQIKLEFIKPFVATNTTEFSFKNEAGKTVVIWSMFGKNSFMLKAFGLMMNMDKMVGRDFEKGLASMKSVVEAKK